MAKTISNTDDVIDGRDIIARIDELEDMEGALSEAQDELKTLDETDEPDDSEERTAAEIGVADAETAFGADEQKELKILREIVEEAGSELRHGEALIRDSYFKTYAMELANDCGDMNSKQASQWPFTCIDWEQAADELKQDYTSVDFDGETYWTRA